ncbi:DUF3611 family protein [uncultured Thiodictyon sp.]|jgi:hypothetical protein|uniref:DUF3611 family protein n=1 Tax=uncultured Thiodictyon sp. TaxID=1846217 RepID=UPI0025D29929|nr:DUF3611 family protein [uncultured Thiodictyon sp.]
MSLLQQVVEGLHVAKIEGLAKTFTRLGRIGFWLQVVLGSIPLVVMFYVFVFSGSISGPRSGLPIVGLLSLANMLVLLFTIVWFSPFKVHTMWITRTQQAIGRSRHAVCL